MTGCSTTSPAPVNDLRKVFAEFESLLETLMRKVAA